MEEEASPGDETKDFNKDIRATEVVTRIVEVTKVDSMVGNLTNHPLRGTQG